MIDEIMYTFDKNFLRLRNLITLYKSISSGAGRKPANTLDLLRATAVLTHSTLEDYLRSLLMWKLPFESSEKLNNIPLIGTSTIGRATKFNLGELSTHRFLTIDEVINLSVKEYLNTVSFNDTDDIAKALTSISIELTEEIRETFPSLNEMIKRRHNIVHRADRDILRGRGNHKIKSISVERVEKWQLEIDKLVIEINKNFI